MPGSSEKLTYDGLSRTLIEAFPELRERYEKELDWWGSEKPGQHIVYGDIFTPYLAELLEADRDTERLERAFRLLEELIANNDVRVQEVAVVTVLEYLQGKPCLLRQAEPYMGPLASAAVRDLEEFWEKRRSQSH